MVVDDEQEIRKLIGRYLQLENMEFIEAENGYKALTYIQEEKVDLIILDIMMKGIDGFEVLS